MPRTLEATLSAETRPSTGRSGPPSVLSSPPSWSPDHAAHPHLPPGQPQELLAVASPRLCHSLVCTHPEGPLKNGNSSRRYPAQPLPAFYCAYNTVQTYSRPQGAERSRTGIPPFPKRPERSHWGPSLLLFPARHALSQCLPGSRSCFIQASGEMLPLPGSFSNNPIQTYPLLSSRLSRATHRCRTVYIYLLVVSPGKM